MSVFHCQQVCLSALVVKTTRQSITKCSLTKCYFEHVHCPPEARVQGVGTIQTGAEYALMYATMIVFTVQVGDIGFQAVPVY